MGMPGWPELAFCTASADSIRIVLMQSSSRVVVIGCICLLSQCFSAVRKIRSGHTFTSTCLGFQEGFIGRGGWSALSGGEALLEIVGLNLGDCLADSLNYLKINYRRGAMDGRPKLCPFFII